MNENITTNPKGIAGQYRQGDLLIERIAAIPAGGLRDSGERIIARGEKTGHKHELSSGHVFHGPGNICYFTLEEDADLNHEEHPTVGIPAGTYKVTQQRQYNPRSVARATPVVD